MSAFPRLHLEKSICCPRCGGEAKFVRATARPLPRSFQNRSSIRPKKLRIVAAASNRLPGTPDKIGIHFDGFGRAANHNWLRATRNHGACAVESARDYGTSVCRNCHSHQAVKLNWPNDAFFQTSFAGKHLWLANREQIIALIALLEGRSGTPSAWQHWFNNALPTAFKTKSRARHCRRS